jgi:hypothetical protein
MLTWSQPIVWRSLLMACLVSCTRSAPLVTISTCRIVPCSRPRVNGFRHTMPTRCNLGSECIFSSKYTHAHTCFSASVLSLKLASGTVLCEAISMAAYTFTWASSSGLSRNAFLASVSSFTCSVRTPMSYHRRLAQVICLSSTPKSPSSIEWTFPTPSMSRTPTFPAHSRTGAPFSRATMSQPSWVTSSTGAIRIRAPRSRTVARTLLKSFRAY